MAVVRRQFLTLFASALAVGPGLALAQVNGRVPKVGFLMGLANDAEAQTRVKAFVVRVLTK